MWAAFLILVFGLQLIASAQTTPSTEAISAGTSNVFALKSDGTVWGWGINNDGQLGNGTALYFQPVFNPVQVLGLTGVAAISTGEIHALALKTDGTVWAWGDNGQGELGTSTGGYTQSYTPVQITGLSGVVSIKAGDNCSLALKNDGTVWSWGVNDSGQLGDGTTTQRQTPVQVLGLSNVVAVVTGNLQSLALAHDGTVWAWGGNARGQLGDGTQTMRLTPVQVTNLTQVVAIKTRGNRSMALKSDGTVWAWGGNGVGQVGDGTNTLRLVPVQVSSLTNIVQIAAGDTHGLALKSDGTLWAWGYNYTGQIGDGTAITHLVPVQVLGFNNIVSIDAAAGYSAILKSDGSIYTWGDNSSGISGDGTSSAMRLFPVQVTPFTDVKAVVQGNGYYDPHILCLRKDGTVWAWGADDYGQLGDGATSDRYFPAKINSLTTIVAVAAADRQGMALKNDGSVWTWGLNDTGQLGDGTLVDRNTPAQLGSLDGITAIAAGDVHCLALKNNGTIWAWGWNSHGQLGDGTTTNRPTPLQVSGLTGVVAISGGWGHSIALRNDGTVWTWGYNGSGQLGDGTLVDHWLPQQVPGFDSVVAISANNYGSMALKADGTLWAWGWNYHGASGNGTYTDSTFSPVQVLGLDHVATMVVAGATNVATKTDGTVWAWGDHGTGQLGNGEPVLNSVQQSVPVQVFNINGVVSLGGGSLSAFALKADGTLWGWGNNRCGIFASPPYDFHPARAAMCLISSVDDTNQNGISDAWEMQNFGTLSRNGTGDYDSDGLTDIQEFVKGTDPTKADQDGDLLTDFVDPYPFDFYNNSVPVITIIGGNNQSSVAGAFNGQPFDVAVWNSDGTAPLSGAPIVFTVTTGGGSLATTNAVSTPLTSSLPLATDVDGSGQAYYRQPSGAGLTSQITVTAGGASVAFISSSLSVDLSGVATLPDVWQMQYFGHLGVDPNGNPSGDGMSNLYKYAMGLNPLIDEGANDKDGDGIQNNQDARPNSNSTGQLTITISTPLDGAIFP